MAIFSGNGQDLHFSQFYNSPLSTNPANTGFIPDADYRLGLLYRNQWSSIMAMPYKTMSAFADAQLMRDKFDNGWLGVGAFVQSDVVGLEAFALLKFTALWLITKCLASAAY